MQKDLDDKKMSKEDRFSRIREALEMGPTPGPWRVLGIIYRSVATTDDTNICYLRDSQSGDAHLIAACDTDTIRELLAERDALAAEVERLREALEQIEQELNYGHIDMALRITRSALKGGKEDV